MPNINTNFFNVDESCSSESDEDEPDILDSWLDVVIKLSRWEFNGINSGLTHAII